MDSAVKFVSAWPDLIARAFSDHTLAFAIVTVAAIGIFVVLQRELRPYHAATNLAYVATGWLVLVSVLVFIINFILSARRKVPAGNDPWGGASLEWATTSPPPAYNFDTVPPFKGRDPLWILKREAQQAAAEPATF